MFEKENVFFWMLPFHRVVQPDLETLQQQGDLCDTGVLSAIFGKIYLNSAR